MLRATVRMCEVRRWAWGLGLAVAVASAHGAGTHQGEERLSAIVGGVSTHVVRSGDTLWALGGRFGVTPATLARANGLAADARLARGQALRIDNRHIVPSRLDPGELLVNVPQRMLFFGGEGGVEGYPVAVGRRTWPTPVRSFVVVAKQTEPTWEVPASILEESLRSGKVLPPRVLPGPDNPLGAFWIGLSVHGVGIHGTNAPSQIFLAATHGCIRMHPADIERLFPRIDVGAAGRIIYEPEILAQQDGAVYLEVHPDVYRREPGAVHDRVRTLAMRLGLSEQVDWLAADAVAAAADGIARDVTK